MRKQAFKAGDHIRMLESCSGNEKREIYIVKYDEIEDRLKAGGCSCQYKWELVAKKRLTQEEKLQNVIGSPNKTQINEKKYLEDNVKNIKRNLIGYKDSIEYYKKEIIKQTEILIEKEEELKNTKIVIKKNWFKDALYNLNHNPKVNKVIIENNALIIKTNDLVYRHKNKDIPNYNLGAYYILFDNYKNILIVNYKKYNRFNNCTYFHPNIRSNFNCCMGEVVKRNVHQYLESGDFDLAVNLIILFLEEPNYGTPYVRAEIFACSQPVTLKDDYKILFEPSSWQKENWDQEKFKADFKVFMEKVTGEKINLTDYI
jgi:hypothetical protein